MARVIESIESLRGEVRAAKAGGRVVGLVPTMGALHTGHVRLVEQCRAESGFVVVSLFVNPTQFGPNEDFERYPRTLASDLALCEGAGADVVFAPSAAAMYPRGRAGAAFVEVPELSDVLEGAFRPGHFRGVATVVLKLFAIAEPDIAFFGRKDYQQQLIIRRMVDDFNLPVTIRTVETVREADGLAMSSRNRYLDPEQRRAATVLSRALGLARDAVERGERDANRVRQVLVQTLESEPAGHLDYAEVVDGGTLQPLFEIAGNRSAVALLAVRFGATRLIDNITLAE